jgi:uncharacterized membrane protein
MWLGIHDGTAWWIAFAGIWMLIFWGPIIALVVGGIVNVSRDKDQPAQRKNSREIAQSRYSHGAITGSILSN